MVYGELTGVAAAACCVDGVDNKGPGEGGRTDKRAWEVAGDSWEGGLSDCQFDIYKSSYRY